VVSIDFSTPKVEIPLKELIDIVRLVRNQLDKKHRKLLKEMLTEIQKIYTVIVDATSSFVEIPYKDPEFSKKFAEKRAAFDKQYKMDKESVGFRCKKVKEQLDKLLEPESSEPSFFSRIINRRDKLSPENMEKLEIHVNKWFAVDEDVYHSLHELQEKLMLGLDSINEVLRTKGTDEADSELQKFIVDSRTQFDKIKVVTAELESVSKDL
jgi:hypothetical protein